MLKESGKYLLKLVILLLLIFAFERFVFIGYYLQDLNDVDLSTIGLSFFKALPLDLSACTYVVIFPILLLTISNIYLKRGAIRLLHVFIWFCLILIASLYTAEINLFEEWGVKLNSKAIMYLENPSEVILTAGYKRMAGGLLWISLTSGLFIWLYHKFVRLDLSNKYKNPIWSILVCSLMALGTSFIALRGGFKAIPINQSNVYYSTNNTLNLATVNTPWNLAHSFEQNAAFQNTNPYKQMSSDSALAIISALRKVEKDTTIMLFNIKKPNIVLLILESWPADLVDQEGKEKITPEFNALLKDGLYFSKCYASGMRSDQGIAAIMSGYPAQPSVSIIKQPNKYPKLACINTEFKKQDYHTSFYFGGQLTYGNIKGYMYYNGFDKITEESDIESDIPRGYLGIHDEFMFDHHLDELEKAEEPFFSSLFTMSSHSPYDMPIDEMQTLVEDENPFANAMLYSDRCLGNYIRAAKTKQWYNNTIFILIADHTHATHWKRGFYSKSNRRIPLLFFGEPLKKEFKGKTVDYTVAQHDIASTILNQLSMDDSAFTWSRNMMNPTLEHFAFYEAYDGLGWIHNEDYFAWHRELGKNVEMHIKDPSLEKQYLKEGHAYLQVLFDEFLSY